MSQPTGLEATGEERVAQTAAWLSIHPSEVRVALAYYAAFGAEVDEERAVVTDNARHFLPLHRESVARGRMQHGLVLFTNRSSPRHRPDAFVRALVAALDVLLAAEGRSPGPDDRVVWLSPT